MTKKIARFSSFPHLPGILESSKGRGWSPGGAQRALRQSLPLTWSFERWTGGNEKVKLCFERAHWEEGSLQYPPRQETGASLPHWAPAGGSTAWSDRWDYTLVVTGRYPRKTQASALARSLREQKNTSIKTFISHLLPRAPFYSSPPCSWLHCHWPLINHISQAASSGFWLVVDKGKHVQEMRGWEDVIMALSSHPRPAVLAVVASFYK